MVVKRTSTRSKGNRQVSPTPVDTEPVSVSRESSEPIRTPLSPNEGTDVVAVPDRDDLDSVKRLRLQSGEYGGENNTSILAQRGVDRFKIQKKKIPNLLPGKRGRPKKSLMGETTGPLFRKIRDKRFLFKCVEVKPKYSKEAPFIPVYVPGILKVKPVSKTLREESLGFDQYAKVEVPENEEEKAGAGYERYFEQTYNGGKTHLTSDNTLAQLQALETHNLIRGIAQAKAKLSNAISWLSKLNMSLFPQWRFEIDQGFNLLFYGYGSKRNTLEQFAREHLINSEVSKERSKVVVINGYFPDLTIRSILTTIAIDSIGLSYCSITKPMEAVAAIRSHFEKDQSQRVIDKLYILVHNLDGENLRSSAAQQMFAGLCGIPQVTIVASIDNIRSSLLWDQADLSLMNFLWHELVTYAPYEAETSFESSPLLPLGAHVGGQISIRAVTHVLASLNDKAKGIFKLLLEAQVKSEDIPKKDPANEVQETFGKPLFGASFSKPAATDSKPSDEVDTGLSSDQLYTISRQKFLTSSLPAFQASLREFLDHGLIKETKSSTGTHYHVPAPIQSLKEILKMGELASLK
ncbi:Origin recognition complex subunit 2 [Entomophthora muscae]|uniref:Origin recognition complex subunit 2 n=1 Tax=Entomophthora muscae TaxID=34485 RepID=A0ACC2TR70_9FUNG|nr:Origin recognition complex subunit 2 [Entomophthora muscae]